MTDAFVIARYHPLGLWLAPGFTILICGGSVLFPHLYPGGVEAFLDSGRRAGAFYYSSFLFGSAGVVVGLVMAATFIRSKGVAVRYDGSAFHFTQATNVAIPRTEIVGIQLSSTSVHNFIVVRKDGSNKTIYGMYMDRSPFEIAVQIHAISGLPPPIRPDGSASD